MAISWNKITVGDELLDIHSERMGNTTMRRLGCWPVKIVSMDSVTETAMVRWNGNPPTMWTRRRLERLYRKPTKKYLEQNKSVTRR
jgi:hypothetical protein